jgi:hypothetical protein
VSQIEKAPWALDLFLGRVTRPHHDVDIALFREDQAQLRSYLSVWKWQKLNHGQFLSWQPNEFVVPPIHELSATCQGERLEFLLNERLGDRWLYRRNLKIGRDLNHFRFAYDGIPYLPPEIVLLYKTKHRGTKILRIVTTHWRK